MKESNFLISSAQQKVYLDVEESQNSQLLE